MASATTNTTMPVSELSAAPQPQQLQQLQQPQSQATMTTSGPRDEQPAPQDPSEEGGVGGGSVLIRIHVPELNVNKCLQFARDELVWNVKQQCLAAMSKVQKTTLFQKINSL